MVDEAEVEKRLVEDAVGEEMMDKAEVQEEEEVVEKEVE